MNPIFERTWGARAGARPVDEYWKTVIAAVKAKWPEFKFIAEAYWDLEWELQQHGFDYCYDKKLYDRMEKGDAESVRLHLLADRSYQEKMVRFIENHDEPRAAATFGGGKDRAAAVAILTLPGAKLLYEGQFEGRKVRLPVFLGRCPAEPADQDLAAFYGRLLKAVNREVFRSGEWLLCERSGWPDNQTCLNMLALVNPERLRRILTRMLDENEFLGPHGIRSISKFHQQNPYVLHVDGQEYRVDYLPAESNTGMFGGNSNWRGPVWMPINALIIRALQNFYLYYGDNFKIECPTGSGKLMNLFEVSKEIADRLSSTFTRDEHGRRPVYGGIEKFQTDPHWRDLILFFEYFHGDNGAGLGASHQTGWTGLVAKLIELYGFMDSESALAGGKTVAFVQGTTATKAGGGAPRAKKAAGAARA